MFLQVRVLQVLLLQGHVLQVHVLQVLVLQLQSSPVQSQFQKIQYTVKEVEERACSVAAVFSKIRKGKLVS